MTRASARYALALTTALACVGSARGADECAGIAMDLKPPPLPTECQIPGELTASAISNLASDVDAGQINLGQRRAEVMYYHCSGAYDRDVEKTLRQAQDDLDRAIAAAAKDERLAIVLDIDETSLSNWPQMHANELALTVGRTCPLPPHEGIGCGFNDWVEQGKAPPLEPTRKLFVDAITHGVHVFFITGRGEIQRGATVRNLCRAGFAGWSGLFLKPADAPSTRQFKAQTRAALEHDGHRIVANIGDQYSDLVGDAAGPHSERSYKVPNPFYFLP